MRYELTKYLNRHNIEGFSLSQLKYIRNGLDQDWNYSNDILGDIRLYKKNGGSIKHLECICKYYSKIDGYKVQQKENKYATCRDARALLLRKDPNEDTPRCIDCHTQALQKYKDGELKRINNANTIKKRILKNL